MQSFLSRGCVRALRPVQTLTRRVVNRAASQRAAGSRPLSSSPRWCEVHFQYCRLQYSHVSIPIRSFSQSPFRSATPSELSKITATVTQEEGEVGNDDDSGESGEGEEGGDLEGTGEDGGGKGGGFNLWRTKKKRFGLHITNLVRKGKVEEAEQVFQHMLSASVRPTTAIFNNLIAGLSRIGDAQKAFKYFNNLKKRGLFPTDHTYASLFRSCAEMGPTSLSILEKIVSEIDRRGILLNTIATNSLIVAMATCGLVDRAFQVYLDMVKRRESPDVTTFTVLLSACARDRQRGMEWVQHIWHEMRASGIEPDLVCYNTLLQCLKEAGISEDLKRHGDMSLVIPAVCTRDLHKLFAQFRSGVDSTSLLEKKGEKSRRQLKSGSFRVVSIAQVHLHLFGTAPFLLHISKSGWRFVDSYSVEQFLCAMGEQNIVPDIHTLNHLSQLVVDWAVMVREVGVACDAVGVVGGEKGVAYGEVGVADGKVGVASDNNGVACGGAVGVAYGEEGVASSEKGVATRQVIPDSKCLVAAARLQSRLGNIRGAEVLRVFGEEAGLSLGPAGWQSMAGSCLSLAQGMQLLSRMKESGVNPDQHTMAILLGNAASRRNYKYLVVLMKEMRHCKMQPNETTVDILKKVADGQIPQSPRMKLSFDGFKGYYTIWKKHYPEQFF